MNELYKSVQSSTKQYKSVQISANLFKWVFVMYGLWQFPKNSLTVDRLLNFMSLLIRLAKAYIRKR